MRKELAMRMSSCNAQDLANICWGLALLDVRDETLMRAIVAQAVQGLKMWSRKDLSFALGQIIWAHAKLRLNYSELLEVAVEALPSVIRYLGDWNVCALVWSYIKLDAKQTYPEVWQLLSAEVSQRGFDAKLVSRARFGPDEWRDPG